MPEIYFFNGHLRWTVFWENPNCWAAFLACLLAGLWAGQGSLRVARASRLPTGCVPHPALSWRGAGRPSSAGGTPALPVAGLLVAYVVELGIWFLLVKTYSRGGLVAAIAGMVFFFGVHGRGSILLPSKGNGRFRNFVGSRMLPLLSRLALVAVLCAAAGFISRFSPGYVAQDKSVLNRLDDWKGALVMIHDSPFHGWGYKLGGMMYQNWYQPLWHETRPIGFVNSYLEVAVEQGSLVLFFVVVCACALLLFAVKFRKVTWVAAAGASLFAWLVCNLWSSIWLWPGLWILPAVAVVCIMLQAGGLIDISRWLSEERATPPDFDYNKPHPGGVPDNLASRSGIPPGCCLLSLGSGGVAHQASLNHRLMSDKPPACLESARIQGNTLCRILAVSLAAGAVVWAGILVAGHALAKDMPFQARPAARGDAAIVSRRGERESLPQLRAELWVDAAVTGRYWGKALRTILENNPCGSFIVYAPWALRANRMESMATRHVYTGFQAARLSGTELDNGKIIIIHPTVYPPASGNANLLIGPPSQTGGATRRHANQEIGVPSPEITVCLPAFDTSAYNLPWRRWAAENGARLIFSPQGGARIDPDQNRDFWRSLLFNE